MFFPVNGDPYYSSVSLLLPLTGTDGSTTFTDVSPTPKTITRNGNTQIATAQSKWGQGSGYFDGTGDYLSTPYSTAFDFGSGDATIEAWVYIAANSNTDADGNRAFVIYNTWSASTIQGWTFTVMGTPTTTGTGLGWDSWASGAGTLCRATVSISQTSWHHIAASVSGGTRRLFLDGVLQSSTIIDVGGGHTSFDSFNDLNIGSGVNGSYPLPLNGYMQDLRITKGVARYADSFTVPSDFLPSRAPEHFTRPILEPSFHQIARLGL